MALPLFDTFTGCGGATPGSTETVTADDLLAEMARVEIARALVRRVPDELESDVAASNARLYGVCDSHASLLPCPIVVPSTGGDLPPEEAQVADHLARGCGAVWIRPARDHWSLAPWCCDRLFKALAERRLPVLLLASLVGLEQAAEIAARRPGLPLLLAGVGYDQQRVLLPLLHRFPNTYLILGEAYAVHGGLEQLVATVGGGRVLFGTGFPRTEAMTAITYLLYSGLDEEARRAVGAENLERLLAEVVR